uniref:Fibroblast growth factor 1-like protein n=1 Tax=Cladonema pacificum TaxID=499903 RepID=A0A8D6H9Z2_9CNID|nr:fibroblast growth factor 1-like protein [Cladonema pacificum]
MKDICQTLITFLLMFGLHAKPRPKRVTHNAIDMRLKLPSFSQKVRLFSRQGFFITIDQSGNIGGTRNKGDRNNVFLMESFSFNLKRIRKPDSYFLSINKNGIIETTLRARKECLFLERLTGNFVTYENMLSQYMIVMTTKQKPLHGTPNNFNTKETQFVVMRITE